MLSSRAYELHQAAVVVDGHSDILIPVADGLCRLNEEPVLPAREEWMGVPGYTAPQRPTPYQLSDYDTWFGCTGQYHIPAFARGNVSGQVAAIYIEESHLSRPVERALQLIGALHREIAANPERLMLARHPDDVLAARAEGKTALILAFEGAEPLGHDVTLLDAYWAAGLRFLGLSHSRRNIWADGTQVGTATGGLTERGRKLVGRLNTLGIVVDLAHLGDAGFWEVLELSTAPPVVTHTTLQREDPDYRQPWLAVDARTKMTKLQALAARGGVVGILFWNQPHIDDVVRDIMLVLEHAGPDHVALGSDFYGRALAPASLTDIGDLPQLTEALLRARLSEETILKILGGNWLRVWRAADAHKAGG